MSKQGNNDPYGSKLGPAERKLLEAIQPSAEDYAIFKQRFLTFMRHNKGRQPESYSELAEWEKQHPQLAYKG